MTLNVAVFGAAGSMGTRVTKNALNDVIFSFRPY